MQGKDVLLVFDGFDEFPVELRKKSLVVEVISGSCLPYATVLVTSRPSATVDFQLVCQVDEGKHIEVVGFSQDQIKEYVKSIFTTELLSSFHTYLSGNPFVKGMMYNPLNCTIVVEVCRETYMLDKHIPHTLTQLYTELSLCLLSRHLSAKGDSRARGLPNRLEELPHDLLQQLVKLGEMAFRERVREVVIFKQSPEGCSNLGLINTCSELYGRKENVTYNFLHLTLQEYLSAFYISQLTTEEQKKLFATHCEMKHLNVVWRFVCGLTRMQAIGWEGFRGKRKMGYEVKDGVLSVWPLVVQCLYESQDVDSCERVFGKSEVEYCGDLLEIFVSPFDAFAVGYCVSRCRNVWNVKLGLKGMPELVEMLVCGLKSVEYCGGSVRKLSCNHIKDEGMRYFQQLPPQILRQLRFLDVGYCCLGKAGFDLLADCIPLLSNLTRLKVEDNPGGNGGTVKLLQALSQHDRIEYLNVFNTGMGIDDVNTLSEVIHPLGSLKDLWVGDGDMSTECVHQMVRIVLSHAILSEDTVGVCTQVSIPSRLHCEHQ